MKIKESVITTKDTISRFIIDLGRPRYFKIFVGTLRNLSEEKEVSVGIGLPILGSETGLRLFFLQV
jgi:hypothetical protein